MRARPEALDALAHTTMVLKQEIPGVRCSGNNWHRRYSAPGRAGVTVLAIEDRREPPRVAVRSANGVKVVDPDDSKALVDAYLEVSDPPSEAEGALEQGGAAPPSEAERQTE